MTTTNDRVALTAAVERLSTDLRRAQRDVALLQRIKAAEANAKRLAVELQEAQAALTAANVAEVQSKRAGAYAAFEDVHVSAAPGEAAASVLHIPFVITVTRRVYDGYETRTQTLTFNGFNSLPSDAFGYLVEVHSDRVPAAIRALAPNDVYDAFGVYFTGQRRGFLSIAAAA